MFEAMLPAFAAETNSGSNVQNSRTAATHRASTMCSARSSRSQVRRGGRGGSVVVFIRRPSLGDVGTPHPRRHLLEVVPVDHEPFIPDDRGNVLAFDPVEQG